MPRSHRLSTPDASIVALVLLCSVGACKSEAVPLMHPWPAPETIAATEAARLGGLWSGKTSYCVEPDGRASRVSTHCPSGDPGLDRIYRETIAGWTFKPARQGGRPVQACTTIDLSDDFPRASQPNDTKPKLPIVLEGEARKTCMAADCRVRTQ